MYVWHVATGAISSRSTACAHAEGSSPRPDERVVQRRALLQRLRLSTSHYLKLQKPFSGGQAAQVAMQPLLNTAAICLMPDELGYQWWQAPAAAQRQQPTAVEQAGAVGTTDAAASQAQGTQESLTSRPESNTPGQVEVKPVSGLVHGHTSAPDSAVVLSAPSAAADKASASTSTASRTETHGGMMKDSASTTADMMGDGSPFGCSPVHVQLQVLQSLRQLLSVKLDAIAGGSAEEDRMLAKQADCSYRAGMALEYRAVQKEIAAAALQSLRLTTAEVVCSAAARLPGHCCWASSKGRQGSYHQVRAIT